MGKKVVIDLEMCNVPEYRRKGNYKCCQETIQIGAVLVNEDGCFISEFNTLVRPEYGFIDPYIQGLTGIGRKDLTTAPIMREALTLFTNWLPKESLEIVQWSNSDWKQIRYEMEAKEIMNNRLLELADSWVDCQKLFSEKMNSMRQYRLVDALFIADVDSKGTEHDALSDAINTALLYEKLNREEELERNTYYEKATSDEIVSLSFSLGNLFQNLNLQISA